MLDIGSLIDEAKTKKIKRYPTYVNRASNIGHPCTRFLVFCRTHWQERKLYSAELQRIFDLGRVIERMVLSDLMEAGVSIEQQETPFFDENLQLSGHIDGMFPFDGKHYPFEIKGLAPYTWDKISKWRDFLRMKQPFYRSYPYQIQAYLYGHNEQKGIMFLRNKMTAQDKILEVEMDWDLCDEICKKCVSINHHVSEKTLPDPIDWEDSICGRCDFLEPCYPGRSYGDGLTIVDDSELEAMLQKREALAQAAKDYKEVDDSLKAAIKGKSGLIVGPWQITGRWVDKKPYTVNVKASRYWLPSIKKMEQA